jgi:hypothetical protein
MNWRTRDDQTRQQSQADCHVDAIRARLGSLAGTARHSLEITNHGRLRLGTALFDDLQMARRTRQRFGAADVVVTE